LLLLIALACTPTPPAGTSGVDDSASDTEAPPELLQVDFDEHPAGPYALDALIDDWPGVFVVTGLSRLALVEGDQAFAGRSLRVTYPEGCVGPFECGGQWVVHFEPSHEVLYLSYRVRFGEGFDFVRGGKLPGLKGGHGNTGGDVPDGTDGWSARMMWRSGGAVVQYVYHPDQPGTYGEDMAWERLFVPGEWHQVEHRIAMNTPGENDGSMQGWWDGALALDRSDLRWRDVDTFSIDGFYFSTFFGGGDPSWAPVRDEHIFYDDFVVSTEPITH